MSVLEVKKVFSFYMTASAKPQPVGLVSVWEGYNLVNLSCSLQRKKAKYFFAVMNLGTCSGGINHVCQSRTFISKRGTSDAAVICMVQITRLLNKPGELCSAPCEMNPYSPWLLKSNGLEFFPKGGQGTSIPQRNGYLNPGSRGNPLTLTIFVSKMPAFIQGN